MASLAILNAINTAHDCIWLTIFTFKIADHICPVLYYDQINLTIANKKQDDDMLQMI